MFTRFRKWIALSAAVLAASVAVAVAPGSASAETIIGFGSISLAHQPAWGTFAAFGVIEDSPIQLTSFPFGTWQPVDKGWTSEAGTSGEGFEFEAVTTNRTVTTWCLAAAGVNVGAELKPCSDGGTVWVLVDNEGGYLMFSRYSLNLGKQVVLCTIGVGRNIAVQTLPYPQGTGVYYRWNISGLNPPT
jgi:hypothetical protein